MLDQNYAKKGAITNDTTAALGETQLTMPQQSTRRWPGVINL